MLIVDLVSGVIAAIETVGGSTYASSVLNNRRRQIRGAHSPNLTTSGSSDFRPAAAGASLRRCAPQRKSGGTPSRGAPYTPDRRSGLDNVLVGTAGSRSALRN